MEKYIKRGVALLLAVILVISAGLYGSSDRTLRATEEDEIYTEGASQDTEGETQGEETVQEIIIEDGTASLAEEIPAEGEALDQEGSSADQKEEAPAQGEASAEEAAREEVPVQGEVPVREEVKMPAVKLSQKAGNILVELSAPEGVLPEGVTMKAARVQLPDVEEQLGSQAKGEGRELLDFFAVDITLYDKEGQEIQPKGEVSVVFHDVMADEKVDAASVYHVDTASGSVDKVADIDAAASDAKFQAEHFSVYVSATYSAAEPAAEGQPVEGDRTYSDSVKITVQGNAANFTAKNIQHAKVGYIFYNAENGEAALPENPTIKSVQHEQTITIENFTTETKAGYMVFFVKPEEGYLLTGVGASGAGLLYEIEGDKDTISEYPSLGKLCDLAKKQGYVACFGFMANAGAEKENQNFEVEGYQPGLKAVIQSSKTSDIKINDDLTLTVTVTPEKELNGKALNAQSVKADTITVGEQTYNNIKLEKKSDGTFVGQIRYKVTEDDCKTGTLNLTLDASVEYSYVLGLTGGGAVTTQVTTKGQANAVCRVAPHGKVVYAYKFVENGADSAKSGITLPESKSETVAEGSNHKLQPAPVNAEDSIVEDTANKGYWTYTGWHVNDAEEITAPGTEITMSAQGIIVYGRWTFRPYYTVEYKLNGGNKSAQTEKLKHTELKEGMDTPKISDPTRKYYTFDGWNPEVAEKVTGNAAYIAKWELNKDNFSLTATGYEEVYDAAAHGPKEIKVTYTEKGKNPVIVTEAELQYCTSDTDTWSTTQPTITNVGEASYRVRALVDGWEVAAGTFTLKVTPYPVIVKTDSAEKPYDGEPLTAGGSITAGETKTEFGSEPVSVTLCCNETISIQATGTQTEVTQEGTPTKNNYTILWAENDGSTAKSSNYKVTSELGELKVTAPKPGISVTKTVTSTPAEERDFYKAGEKVTYSLQVKNTGDVPLYHIVLTDELTGNVGDKSFKIEKLMPGKSSEAYEVSHTVTAQDIADTAKDNGTLVNVAEAKGEYRAPAGGNAQVFDDDRANVILEQAQPSINITKTASLGKDEKAGLGQEVAYTLQVVNNGNVAVRDIKITDELTGNTAAQAIVVGNLEPRDSSETYTVTYIVTENDLRAGQVVNTAQASGTAATGEDLTDKDDATIQTEAPVSHVTITKEVTNKPADGKAYGMGEVIKYKITAKNDGTLTVNEFVITDELTGDTWTVESIKPGESVSKDAAYKVTRNDIFQKKSITNIAEGKGKTDGPDDPALEIVSGEVISPVQQPYTLTIHYVDTAGNTLAKDYAGQYAAGEQFQVDSPQVAGYTPNYSSIKSGEEGMPAQNLEFRVVYTANPAPENPTPQGNTPDRNPQPVEQPEETSGETGQTSPAETEAPQEPVVAVVTRDEEGNYQLTPVRDIETPLGNLNLGDHDCCIFHFLVMLVAAILLGFYTRSRKKHQAKIFELRETLELERQKRGLPRLTGEEKR